MDIIISNCNFRRKASEEVSITSPVKLEIDVPKVSVSLPNGVPNKIQVPTGEIRKRKPRRFVSRGKAEITEELLATAVNEVLDAGATANSVSKKYGIPKSTLRNHVLKNARLRGLEGRNLQELSAHSSEDTGEEDIVVAID